MPQNDINQEAIQTFANMFGFVPADESADESQVTLQYSHAKEFVSPEDYVNVAQAFSENAAKLELPEGIVNYSRNGVVISGSEPLTAGDWLSATVKQDGKGA